MKSEKRVRNSVTDERTASSTRRPSASNALAAFETYTRGPEPRLRAEGAQDRKPRRMRERRPAAPGCGWPNPWCSRPRSARAWIRLRPGTAPMARVPATPFSHTAIGSRRVGSQRGPIAGGWLAAAALVSARRRVGAGRVCGFCEAQGDARMASVSYCAGGNSRLSRPTMVSSIERVSASSTSSMMKHSIPTPAR
jgi:hypothetical protein